MSGPFKAQYLTKIIFSSDCGGLSLRSSSTPLPPSPRLFLSETGTQASPQDAWSCPFSWLQASLLAHLHCQLCWRGQPRWVILGKVAGVSPVYILSFVFVSDCLGSLLSDNLRQLCRVPGDPGLLPGLWQRIKRLWLLGRESGAFITVICWFLYKYYHIHSPKLIIPKSRLCSINVALKSSTRSRETCLVRNKFSIKLKSLTALSNQTNRRFPGGTSVWTRNTFCPR